MTTVKTCRSCNTVKSKSEFTVSKTTSDGCQSYCKKCYAIRRKAYRIANPERDKLTDKKCKIKRAEKIKAEKLAYRLNNPEKVKLARKIAYAKNRETELLKAREYKARNVPKMRAIYMKRQASKISATPNWANKFFIDEAYELAQLRTKITGFRWDVDHVVPLQSKRVCGLHCEFNLAVIPTWLNQSKSNHYWPNMPN